MKDGADEILAAADKAAGSAQMREVLTVLRRLTLDQFAELFIQLPDPRYPGLSRALPRMASVDVQQKWTGQDGVALLLQTIAFMHIFESSYKRITERDLSRATRVLDFGCGYGRLIRAMYYFLDPDQIYGCDPREDSIEYCRDDGVQAHFAISERIPSALPFDGQFDLIYAYSVFTHLSPRVAQQCLNVLGAACTKDGVIVITVRPVEYWENAPDLPGDARRKHIECHQKQGYSFLPHGGWAAIDGDVPYGDTSLSLEWIEKNCPALSVADTMPLVADPNQVVVFLRLR